MDNRDENIRKRAYEMWEQEGRPDGQHESHWQRAEQELAGGAGGPPLSMGGLASSLQPGSVTPAGGASQGTISAVDSGATGEPSEPVRRAAKR